SRGEDAVGLQPQEIARSPRKAMALSTVFRKLDRHGVLRAGMIPVPLPLLWRQEEIVAALRQVGSFFIRQHNRRTCQTRCHTIDDPLDPQYRLCGAR
ncbi:MAG: hypothetical protein WBW59_13000, partial [Pseudolabrys sp.]